MAGFIEEVGTIAAKGQMMGNPGMALRALWRAAAMVVLAVALSTSASGAPSDTSNLHYNIDLSDLYPSPRAWDASRQQTTAAVARLPRFKGTLGRSADEMLQALSAFSAAREATERLATYAGLERDQDVRVASAQEHYQLAVALGSKLSENTSWVAPEILTLGAAQVRSFERQSPELARRFGFFLDDTLRAKPHILSPEGESVMAAASSILQQPDAIFSQLANGELPFPTVTLSDGTKVRLIEPAFEQYRQSANRADRKKVFDAFWQMWKQYQGTLGQTLTTQVMGEEFDASVRHFPDALADALFADNMPEAVYKQLVAQANAGLPTLYRYLKLRKRLLGIGGSLGYYDMYAPLFKLDKPLHFSIADAERIALEVTSVYGPEYTAKLKQGFAGRWMDVLPRTGKASGAYMNGSAYQVHPYLHLNHNYDYESLSTFVHEWGHAVHTLLDDETQPYETSEYSTFIAETASISNEMLLNDYMVAHARNRNEKLYYLGQGLELIRTSFFRQVQFAEFQLAIHQELEQGHALSGQRMTDLYCGLLRKYYGEAQGVTQIDPTYCSEWSYVPHFYYGFYVWQYATSISGAAQFTQAIEQHDPTARARFIDMLKAGGSDYPYNLYKKAGLDMAAPQPYQALIARMNHILDEIDTVLRGK